MSKSGYRLKGNQKVYILPISDWHVGCEQTNLDYLEYQLDIIDEIKSPKRIYLCGDLIECASLRVGNSAFRSNMTADEATEEVINYLKPYRKDIFYTCVGNHEDRLVQEKDFNPIRWMAKELRTKYGYQAIDRFNINGEPFEIYLSHGKGSAAHAHTAQGKTTRETRQLIADMYLEGHNHRLDFFREVFRGYDYLKPQYYAFTGATLRYGGYPDQKKLPYLPEAFLTVSINKERVVRDNKFFIYERRPEFMKLKWELGDYS